MYSKFFLIICLLCTICGCASKEDLSKSSQVQAKTPEQSILQAPELDFATKFGDAMKLDEPEKLLVLINEELKNFETLQKDITALLVLRGLVHSQLKHKDEAFDDMTKAVQKTASAEIYALRGLVLWRGGKLRGAMRDAEYALFKQENLALAQMVQGLVLYSEKEEGKACTSLDKACKQGECYGLEFVQEQGACK